jgi:hypothetical protein
MRRTASEVIRELEKRVARLEQRRASVKSFPVIINYSLCDVVERVISEGSFNTTMSLRDFEGLSEDGAYLISSGRNSILVQQERGRNGYLGYSFDVSGKETDEDILRSETMLIGLEFDRRMDPDTLDEIKRILK